MDLVIKERAELKAKRTALEQQLAAPGISEAKKIAIRHNLDTIGNEITSLNNRLPPVKPPWFCRQWWSDRVDEAVQAVPFGVGAWAAGVLVGLPQEKAARAGVIGFWVKWWSDKLSRNRYAQPPPPPPQQQQQQTCQNVDPISGLPPELSRRKWILDGLREEKERNKK